MASPDGGALLRVIAGEVGGHRGPGSTVTPMTQVHATLSPGALDVLILGGLPIREPVAWMGPFVTNTREEVVQAYHDYQAGHLGSIPAVHGAPNRLVSTGDGSQA